MMMMMIFGVLVLKPDVLVLVQASWSHHWLIYFRLTF